MTVSQTGNYKRVTPLDVATKLTFPPGATFRPTVGEHSVRGLYTRSTEERDPKPPDLVRSKREAQKRAQVQVRRFCKHHGIWRLVTLTLAAKTELADRERVRRRVVRFLEGLRGRVKGLSYVYVLELHPGGHGYHVHLGFSRFVDKRLIAELWKWGWIDVRAIKLKGPKRGHSAAASCARYLGKYATKAEDEGRLSGKHRYERSQSGPIPEIRIEAESFEELVSWVRSKLKRQDVWEWRSWVDAPDWCGPRTLILRE
jgi:hypothetical protein